MLNRRNRLVIPRGQRPQRIALLTDFGVGPYVGQMRLLLVAARRAVPVVELVSDLVPFRADLAAYLLPGLQRGMPKSTLYVCVVDPGVGTERDIVVIRSGGDWWLAPDNGLLVPLLRSCGEAATIWRVLWRPPASSATFHGRDVFLPIAQRLCAGAIPAAVPTSADEMVGAEWPEALAAVCYVDHFGNAMTGLPASVLGADAVFTIAGRRVARARTFGDVALGQAFWLENAFGLVEVAVNQGRADRVLGLGPGDPISLEA
jgi:S-adenosylmethionine hydrolase